MSKSPRGSRLPQAEPGAPGRGPYQGQAESAAPTPRAVTTPGTGAPLSVSIPGQPVGKGRPRFARRGKFVATYTPKATETWEGIATTCLRRAWAGRPVLEQAGVVVLAIGERPKRLMRRCDPVGRLWRTAKHRAPHEAWLALVFVTVAFLYEFAARPW